MLDLKLFKREMRKILLLFILSITSFLLSAQMLADFETPASTPSFTAEGESSVIDNPNKSGINTSEKVGYYNKITGNWHYVTMDFPDTVSIGYNNTLTFKLQTSTQGRIFAKFWIGDEVLIEGWAPEWEFQPIANVWVECTLDLTSAMGKEFTKLELAACIDNDAEANVYFDDIELSNPALGDGSPKVLFKVSNTKVEIGEEITFDASHSYDYDGEIVDYHWDFGDGNMQTGEAVTYAYSQEGNFIPIISLMDNEGKISKDSTIIFVFAENQKLSDLVILTERPEVNGKVEAVFQINEIYANVFNPDEVAIDAEITKPNGDKITLPCFYYVNSYLSNTEWIIDSSYQAWMLRFSSDMAGEHNIRLKLVDTDGERYSDNFTVAIQEGESKGVIHNDVNNKQYYRHATGETYYPLGINIGWNSISNYTKIINNLATAGANTFRYWHTPFAKQALEWKETDFYKGLGFYSQEAAAMSDSLIQLCNARDFNMQLVIFQHGMFSENVNEMWEDNPYNITNGGYVARAEEYFYNDKCKVQTKKLLRYIVARWGYSKNIFAWEFFNEVQFTGIHNEQTSKWYPGVLTWHDEMSRYIESIDPYNHIQTTSAEHHQLPDLDTIKTLDNIQYHLYANELLETQSSLDYKFRNELKNTSIINGEYGTNSEADVPFDMQRHSIWNGIMTQVPRYMWIWDHYTDPSWAQLFSMPSSFLQGEDFAKENSEDFEFEVNHAEKLLKSDGLFASKGYYGYIFDESNGSSTYGAEFSLKNIPFANYTITYYRPELNTITIIDSIPLLKLTNVLELPEFLKGIAFKVKYLSEYTLPIAIAGNDTIVAPGMAVNFSGEYSVSHASDTLTYLWAIDEKPETSKMEIVDVTSMKILVTPDISGVYKISLVVNDGEQKSIADVVTLLVSNIPIANAGNDTIVSVKDRYHYLDGSQSYDPDGDALTYMWRLIEWPNNSKGDLLDFENSNAILKVDAEGEFRATLTVNDGISDSKSDTITLTVNATGIHYTGRNRFTVYPNPTTGILNIDGHDEFITKVEIFDSMGRKVYTKNMNRNTKELVLELENLVPQKGIFYIKINTKNSFVVKQFVFF